MISSPFGIIPIFRGELLVSGNVYIYIYIYIISLNKNYPTPFVDIILPKRFPTVSSHKIGGFSFRWPMVHWDWNK